MIEEQTGRLVLAWVKTMWRRWKVWRHWRSWRPSWDDAYYREHVTPQAAYREDVRMWWEVRPGRMRRLDREMEAMRTDRGRWRA